ncbi:MAG: penicillin-binding transpeptidase domain-containing protein [Pyrinomonadaceae bacterium MAG19_C2-C3]|nr:penicillin-binding transpeptidase domain-containing protein [Pyrinomonadaceae bacterium MAG19_C2-C3]
MMSKIFASARLFAACSFILALSFNAFVPQAEAGAQRKKVVSKKAESKKSTAKTAQADKKKDERGKNARRDDKRTDKKNRQDKRAETAKRGKADRDAKGKDAKGKDKATNKKMTARERRAEANRRAAERRAEIARREAERREAIRRAEIARLARLAAIRAIDQGLRNETQANITRDDTTGEDLEVRRVAVGALGNHAGSIVVMNPQTGRVYAAINQDWALRRGFKPCSTIKLVTGLAGLTYNVIPPAETVEAGGNRYRLDLTDSLAYSNNVYFQNVGGRVGFELMMKTARELGLGEATGINHANESPGRVPVFKSGYAVNHMSSHGDDFAVTPLQLANMTSALTNGGKLLVPHLPRTPQEDTNFKTEVRRQLTFTKDAMQRLQPGMIGAVNYGTAKRAYDVTQTIAGKTGSCIDNGTWVGLFTSVAPIHEPRLAVTVVLKGSGERGKTAAAVAGNVFRNLNTRFGVVNPGAKPVQLATTPRPKLPAAAAAAISDEDAEEGDSAASVDALGTPDNNASGVNQSGVRTVLKPVARPMPNTPISNTPSAAPQPATNVAPATVPGATTNAPDGKFGKSGERPRRVTPLAPTN